MVEETGVPGGNHRPTAKGCSRNGGIQQDTKHDPDVHKWMARCHFESLVSTGAISFILKAMKESVW